ncbi:MULTISPECIES: rhodanese-like domain-containing protein [unclassified Cupriavidus]|uniref:rhodanese-like domain-containing protein n=1 Tax=unclassified Cupriavidus TaxID=2640874 RepID=UPI00087F1791|nr:rhodanese-like domain-containing protein [Cupriavidus sp. YR651]SDC21428.1 Rhodanese-related sulfurtransferase [Cupriavidus sp. YR651]
MQVINATQLAQWLADAGRAKPVLLDVREDLEVRTAAMPGITHIPMGQIPARMNELEEDAEIVCICHHGARSMQVANFLERQGYANVYNLTGGIHAWSTDVDPSVPQY